MDEKKQHKAIEKLLKPENNRGKEFIEKLKKELENLLNEFDEKQK